MEDVFTSFVDSLIGDVVESVFVECGLGIYGIGDVNLEFCDWLVDVFKLVYDFEIFVNIYEMGMIYEVCVDIEGFVYVKMILILLLCLVVGMLFGEVEVKVCISEGVIEVKVEFVWELIWIMEMILEVVCFEFNF